MKESSQALEMEQKVRACTCKTCKALIKLIDDHHADLRFSVTRAGRLCELAVVASTGALGLPEYKVVKARRKYAEHHLGIKLTGPTSNSDKPVHIRHALNNSNHNPEAKNRINLGEAEATFSNNRFFLLPTKQPA
ncbi:hypothetical protein [Pseudomonas indica]|uniref:hypothetical protein n=1 Tax=Pseudomonas indica TaxID=137658 RepID=UPI00146C807D|nr:hypothetical protein [Pseudomonas indica]